MRARLIAFALAASAVATPHLAEAGYEIVPFGGFTQLSNGDVAFNDHPFAIDGPYVHAAFVFYMNPR